MPFDSYFLGTTKPERVTWRNQHGVSVSDKQEILGQSKRVQRKPKEPKRKLTWDQK